MTACNSRTAGVSTTTAGATDVAGNFAKFIG